MEICQVDISTSSGGGLRSDDAIGMYVSHHLFHDTQRCQLLPVLGTFKNVVLQRGACPDWPGRHRA